MQALSQLSYTPTANRELYAIAVHPPWQTTVRRRRSRIDCARADRRSAALSAIICDHRTMPVRPSACLRNLARWQRVDPDHRRLGGLGRALALACAAPARPWSCTGASVRKLEALYDEIIEAGHPEPIDPAAGSGQGDRRGLRQRGERAAGAGRPPGRASCTRPCCSASLGPIEHQSFDAWLSRLRVNVAAPMGLTRALMPLASRSRSDASVIFTLDTRGEAAAGLLGRLCSHQGGLATRCSTSSRTSGRIVPAACASTASCPGPSGRRCAPRRIRARTATRCRRPKRWCRCTCISSPGNRRPTAAHASTLRRGSRRRCVARRSAHSAAARAGDGSRQPAACPATTGIARDQRAAIRSRTRCEVRSDIRVRSNVAVERRPPSSTMTPRRSSARRELHDGVHGVPASEPQQT